MRMAIRLQSGRPEPGISGRGLLGKMGAQTSQADPGNHQNRSGIGFVTDDHKSRRPRTPANLRFQGGHGLIPGKKSYQKHCNGNFEEESGAAIGPI